MVLAGGLATLAVVLVSLTAFLYLLYRDDLRSRRGASGPWAEQEVVRPPGGKLRFALFYWGSRGDFQPLAVLAQQLKREGHSVLINVRERYREAGRSLGLEESELFAQEEDHTEDVVTIQLQGKSGPRGIYYLFRHVAEHTPAYLRQFDEMVTRSKADVLIVNEFALNVGILAADKHRLPLFVLRYTPLFTATTERLCPMVGTGDKGSFLNWLSYTLPSFMRIFLEGPVLRRLRHVHGLRPRPALSYFFGRGFWQYPAIQAYSSTLMPVPHKDIPPWYFQPRAAAAAQPGRDGGRARGAQRLPAPERRAAHPLHRVRQLLAAAVPSARPGPAGRPRHAGRRPGAGHPRHPARAHVRLHARGAHLPESPVVHGQALSP